jgi:hypothetical protein
MLCSVLIPSRKRFNRLRNCIQSIVECAYDPDRVEFMVKLDDDDHESIFRVGEMNEFKNVRTVVTPRGGGWAESNVFLTQLSDASNGQWVWVMNDDVVVSCEKEKWDILLSQVPTECFLVQPGIHQLGGSTYGEHEGGPFPIAPRNCWKKTHPHSFPFPVDTGLHEVLVRHMRWKTKYLDGVRVWHQRDNDQELARHRQ